jgi:hypothetical protein
LTVPAKYVIIKQFLKHEDDCMSEREQPAPDEPTEERRDESTPERKPDPYEGLRELYASKDLAERTEMMLHAVSRPQVEAMLAVERSERADDGGGDETIHAPEQTEDAEPAEAPAPDATRERAEQAQKDFGESSPEMQSELKRQDEEEAWGLYAEAHEVDREKAIADARERLSRLGRQGFAITPEMEAAELERAEKSVHVNRPIRGEKGHFKGRVSYDSASGPALDAAEKQYDAAPHESQTSAEPGRWRRAFTWGKGLSRRVASRARQAGQSTRQPPEDTERQ